MFDLQLSLLVLIVSLLQDQVHAFVPGVQFDMLEEIFLFCVLHG